VEKPKNLPERISNKYEKPFTRANATSSLDRKTVHFIMSAHRTPGSRYSGKYYTKTLNAPGPRRTRVCHFLSQDLIDRLSWWCDRECVSRSHVIETLIQKHMNIEDPAGEIRPFVSEVPDPTITRRQKKERSDDYNRHVYLSPSSTEILTPLEKAQRFGSPTPEYPTPKYSPPATDPETPKPRRSRPRPQPQQRFVPLPRSRRSWR